MELLQASLVKPHALDVWVLLLLYLVTCMGALLPLMHTCKTHAYPSITQVVLENM